MCAWMLRHDCVHSPIAGITEDIHLTSIVRGVCLGIILICAHDEYWTTPYLLPSVSQRFLLCDDVWSKLQKAAECYSQKILYNKNLCICHSNTCVRKSVQLSDIMTGCKNFIQVASRLLVILESLSHTNLLKFKGVINLQYIKNLKLAVKIELMIDTLSSQAVGATCIS
jgi:hypothetical protein